MVEAIGALVVSYLVGSIPTAVLVSRSVAGVDIRDCGDGNMGARNTAHVLGWGPATLVAAVDFAKGAASIGLTAALGLPLEWQLAAGACAVLGHDFPVLAGFRGGQGFASTTGVLFALMPAATLAGLGFFGLIYLASRRYNPSAAVGMALLEALAAATGRPPVLLGYVAALFLTVPAKKLLDLPRRRSAEGREARPPRGGRA